MGIDSSLILGFRLALVELFLLAKFVGGNNSINV
jgi:hypothetical protein